MHLPRLCIWGACAHACVTHGAWSCLHGMQCVLLRVCVVLKSPALHFAERHPGRDQPVLRVCPHAAAVRCVDMPGHACCANVTACWQPTAAQATRTCITCWQQEAHGFPERHPHRQQHHPLHMALSHTHRHHLPQLYLPPACFYHQWGACCAR